MPDMSLPRLLCCSCAKPQGAKKVPPHQYAPVKQDRKEPLVQSPEANATSAASPKKEQVPDASRVCNALDVFRAAVYVGLMLTVLTSDLSRANAFVDETIYEHAPEVPDFFAMFRWEPPAHWLSFWDWCKIAAGLLLGWCCVFPICWETSWDWMLRIYHMASAGLLLGCCCWAATGLRIDRGLVRTPLPEPVFPDFTSCGKDMVEDRRHYFLSVALVGVVVCCFLGMLLTAGRNFCVDKICGPSEVLRAFVESRALLILIVLAQTGILLVVAKACVEHNTMNRHLGVGWEFWVVYGVMHFGGGLMEVLLSGFKGRMLGICKYPEKAIVSTIPGLSEKVDAAKDITLAAVAFTQGEPVVAAISLSIFLLSQAYFLFLADHEVSGELLGAYFPILTASLTATKKNADNSSNNNNAESVRVQQDEGGWCEWGRGLIDFACRRAHRFFVKDCRQLERQFFNFVADQVLTALMKQASVARRAITLAEDLPQSFVAIYLFIAGKCAFSLFLVMSMLIGIVRVVLTCPPVARAVHGLGKPQLLKRRQAGLDSGNRYLVIGVTKELASVCDHGHEDFGLLTREDCGRLIDIIVKEGPMQLFISMIRNDPMSVIVVRLLASCPCLRPSLDRQRPVVPLQAHIFVLWLAAALRNSRLNSKFGPKSTETEEETSSRHLGEILSAVQEALIANGEKRIESLSNLMPKTGSTDIPYARGSQRHLSSLHLAAQLEDDDCMKALMFHMNTPGLLEQTAHVPSIPTPESTCIMHEPKATPMHVAAIYGRVSAIETLMAFRANVNTKGFHGHTPMDWAATLGHTECVDLLQKLGGERSTTV
eukprot:TRINITY_DN29941_c0_g1_i1.p1 TRINITY_DN29941_c0_g1~~TRINITY_DN29941_c0_g1_i1.p1  ORF type:complete len:838 (+),score=95.21 TRINITY_DN29941_c0_g1_i1:44-2515(+)